jgi:hypothetical protein
MSRLSLCKYSYLIPTILIAVSAQGIAGQITGTVTDETGTPIENVEVYFFDALNADLLAMGTTGPTGEYNSGIIPDGNYRIRFDGSYGGFTAEYYGEKDGDFCLGAVLPVSSTQAAVADKDLLYVGPTRVVESTFSIQGYVEDSTTFAPIPGIDVEFRDGITAMPVLSVTKDQVTTTGEDGYYLGAGPTRGTADVRVRYVDLSGSYFPEYYEANDTDDFCNGTRLQVGIKHVLNTSYLDRIPPEDLTDAVIDKVESFDLPNDVSNMLATPLVRAIDLLTDSNTNNDAAVCNQLDAFASRLGIQEKNGKLSPLEADELRQATETAKAGLGC